MVLGKMVLEEITDDTLEFVRQVRSDPEVYKWLWTQKPVSKEEQQKWWRAYQTTVYGTPQFRVWVASSDGIRFGYVQLRQNPFGRYLWGAELGICIASKFHGSGKARQLLQTAIEWAEHCGPDWLMEWLWVHVFSDNERAIHLYESCGFETLPPEMMPKLRDGVAMPTQVMVRAL